MKRIIAVGLMALVIAGCSKEKQEIEESKDAAQASLEVDKERLDDAVDAAKDRAEAELEVEKTRLEAARDATKAQIEADKEALEAKAEVAKKRVDEAAKLDND